MTALVITKEQLSKIAGMIEEHTTNGSSSRAEFYETYDSILASPLKVELQKERDYVLMR